MRATQKTSRARGRGNRKPNGNVVNRVYDSSGPEGKVRGTPQQIIDKYLSLARDAQTAGDRVTSENFLQHAEHYQRILIQATAAQSEQRRDGQSQGQDTDDDDNPRETQGGGHGQTHGQRDGGSDQPQRQNRGDDQGQDSPRRQEAQEQPVPSSDVSGLTTLGPEDDEGDSLLVGENEVTASQPSKRKRIPRGRRSEPDEGKGAQAKDAGSDETGHGAAQASQPETANGNANGNGNGNANGETGAEDASAESQGEPGETRRTPAKSTTRRRSKTAGNSEPVTEGGSQADHG